MTNRLLLLACFLSGAASLFYEILWTRAFSLIMGSTVQATSLIFAAFLTGLALGAWLFGNLSGRLKRPLRAYIFLELGNGCTESWSTCAVLLKYSSWTALITIPPELSFIVHPEPGAYTAEEISTGTY